MQIMGRTMFRIIVWMVLAGALAILAVAVLIPRLTGATPYAVLTGSMTPTYPPGTLIVVKPAAVEDVQIGDAITWQLESGEGTVVTHRVIASRDTDGERQFRTQGDANDAPDADWVRPIQVKGKVWYSVPYLGHVQASVDAGTRGWVIKAIAIGLLGYGGYALVGAVRERVTSREEVPR